MRTDKSELVDLILKSLDEDNEITIKVDNLETKKVTKEMVTADLEKLDTTYAAWWAATKADNSDEAEKLLDEAAKIADSNPVAMLIHAIRGPNIRTLQ